MTLQTWGPLEAFSAAGELLGYISDIKIRHDSVEDSPPAPGVNIGDSFLVKMTGVNVSGQTIRMGLLYRITKPNGTIIDRTIWEAWPYTANGNEHTFIEGPAGAGTTFYIDQPGVWMLYLELLGRIP